MQVLVISASYGGGKDSDARATVNCSVQISRDLSTVVRNGKRPGRNERKEKMKIRDRANRKLVASARNRSKIRGRKALSDSLAM